MAGHKTKYKKPKDLEASQTKAFLKKAVRKALKDYTQEDKDGGMNPSSTKQSQQNVLRKRDKQVIDNVENMVPSKKDVADYYKVNGEHDPKYTAKERAKLQDEDEKTSKDEIKDKIENLTREQKERLVREYVRKKIKKVLAEKKNAKPDFLDLDNDGDKKESMKKAAKDAKKKKAKNEQDEPDADADEKKKTPDADEKKKKETPPAPETPEDKEELDDEGGEVDDEGGEVSDEGGEETSTPSAPPTTSTDDSADDTSSDTDASDDIEAAEDAAETDEKETEDELQQDLLGKAEKQKKAIMKQSLKFQKSDTGVTSANNLKPIIKLGIDNLDAKGKKSFYLSLKKEIEKNLLA